MFPVSSDNAPRPTVDSDFITQPTEAWCLSHTTSSALGAFGRTRQTSPGKARAVLAHVPAPHADVRRHFQEFQANRAQRYFGQHAARQSHSPH